MAAQRLTFEPAVRIESGPADLFDQWYRQYRRDVFQFVLPRVRDADEADDITQECFLKAFRARQWFRGECAPRTWLIGIALNVCRDRMRLWKREQRMLTEELSDEIRDESTGATRMEDDLLLLEVRRGLESLDADLRTALLLKYENDLSFRDLGERLGCSKAMAFTMVRKGLRKLRQALHSPSH